MVVIRLSRTGGLKNPFYHLVVADQRKPRDGHYIERIGYYNPKARGQDIRLRVEKERFDYWVSKGAIASERVSHLVKHFGKNPDEAQKAGPTISDLKKAQVAASAKAKKAAEAKAPTAEEAPKEEARAEEKTAEPAKEEAPKAEAEKEAQPAKEKAPKADEAKTEAKPAESKQEKSAEKSTEESNVESSEEKK